MGDAMPEDGIVPKRIVLVGVGGASCSGKTTLAKHLRSVLKGSFIVHQDDFAPPEQLVPVHPVHKVQDWDDPDGAIEWPRLATFLKRVRREGGLPSDYRSHDGLNKQPLMPVSEEVAGRWSRMFLEIQERARREQGVDVIWGLVDGFLLYWHPDVVRELDVRLFLRVSYDTLKARRNMRFGYHTAVQFSPEGSLWQDPPGYWDDIVWPAYLKAHKDIFIDSDVSYGEAVAVEEDRVMKKPTTHEHGFTNGTTVCNGTEKVDTRDADFGDIPKENTAPCGQPVPRLLVLPAETMDMAELFDAACTALASSV